MPAGFHKVRYFGCYSFGAKKLKAAIHQQLTAQPPHEYIQVNKKLIIKKLLGHDPDVCTNCGSYDAFVTQGLPADSACLFILTRGKTLNRIRAGPRGSSHRIP